METHIIATSSVIVLLLLGARRLLRRPRIEVLPEGFRMSREEWARANQIEPLAFPTRFADMVREALTPLPPARAEVELPPLQVTFDHREAWGDEPTEIDNVPYAARVERARVTDLAREWFGPSPEARALQEKYGAPKVRA